MADLTPIEAAQPVLVVGSSSAGEEQTPVQSSSGGGLHTNVRTQNGTEIAYDHGNPNSATIRAAAQMGVGGAAVSETNRVPTTDILNSALVTAEKTSTSTASIARVGASNLTSRKVIEIYNTGNVVMYVGSSTVTVSGATRGRPLDPKASFVMAISPAVNIYVISASNNTYVVTEGA